MFKLLNIDDMICQSIISVDNPELRKRLANAILLVGGSSKFKGIIDFLEDKLFEKLIVLDNQIERVEIINYPHVDMKTIAWIGGTIIPKLESSKDMWILRDKWLSEVEKQEDLNINKDPINNIMNFNANFNQEDCNFNNANSGKGLSNTNNNAINNPGTMSVINHSHYNNSVNNINNNNDNLSEFKQESAKEKEKDREREKIKRKDRQLEGGPKLIREKCPFKW